MSKARNGNLIIAVRTSGGISAYLAPVPVELSSFNAEAENNNVILTWSTASETNNSGFEIERTSYSLPFIDGGKQWGWEKIGFIDGHGTTTQKNNYIYPDKNLKDGKYSYRLKQIDFDGTSTFSNIVSVGVNTVKSFALYQNFPNPFNPATTISWQSPVGSRQTLKVYNVLGKEVAVLINEYKPAGKYQIEFNSSSLPSGVYFYRLQAGNFTQIKRMVLLK